MSLECSIYCPSSTPPPPAFGRARASFYRHGSCFLYTLNIPPLPPPPRPPITPAAVAFASYLSVNNIIHWFSRLISLTIFDFFFFFCFAVLSTRLISPESSCYECVGTRFPFLYGQRKPFIQFACSRVFLNMLF